MIILRKITILIIIAHSLILDSSITSASVTEWQYGMLPGMMLRLNEDTGARFKDAM